MIEIENLWDDSVKKIADLINKLHETHDTHGVQKEISQLIGFFKVEIPKKKKEEKKLYFIQWSAYQALLKIIKNNPEYLTNFKKDLIWLARNPNKNINERALDMIQRLNLDIENEKCLYLKLEDFEKIMENEDKLEINKIAERLEISFDEALDWIKQLIEEKKINAYISNEAINLIK